MRISATLLSSSLLALGVLALPGSAARSQVVQGPYVAGGIGPNLTPDADLSAEGALETSLFGLGVQPGGSVGFHPGIAGVLSLGWGFGNGLRAEIEGSWRSNDIESVGGLLGAGGFGVEDGRQVSYGIMGNLLLDLGTFGPVVPYVGLGAGYILTDWRDVRLNSATRGLRLSIDDSDGRFAYQGIAGLSFPLGVLPGLAVTAEYRFLGTLTPRLQARVESTQTGEVLSRGTVEADNYNHSLLLGIRYAFGAAPPPSTAQAQPPAASAPVPTPTRSFVVSFDGDRADLNDRARQVIAEAAQNSRRAQETRIEVAGLSDRAGRPPPNQALSQRRAETVASELVRQGVPREEITVTASGETRPLVPTADGVREPQSRRVEIVLR